MATSGGDGSAKTYKKMWVESSSGSTLAQSRRVEGASAPFARNATGINEQVILHDKKPKTPESGGSGLADFLTEVAIAAAVVGAQAFIDKGIPAIKQKLADRRAQKLAAVSVPEPASEVVVAEPEVSELTGTDVARVGAEIDAQQWYQLFFEAVAHGAAGHAHQAISAARWAFLASARVTDDEAAQALATAMRELTPEQLRDRLDRVLEQHPELATEDPATVLRRLFGDDETLPMPMYVGDSDETPPISPRTFEAVEPAPNDEHESGKETRAISSTSTSGSPR